MQALARFVMRGYPQAALAAALTAGISLLLPLLGLLSSAVVALVTLRLGVKDGAAVGALAAALLGGLCALILGSPWPAVASLLVLWLPAWGLAALLRASRSLDLTVLAGGLAGVAAVLLVHVLTQDPAAFWLGLLGPFQETLVKDGIVDEAGARALFGELARWMTGAFAAALVLQWLAGLFIGRWWQAALYNPGGFGAEFRGLRLHRGLAVAGLLLLGAIALVKGPGLFPDLLTVLAPLWLLQGLAVIHQLHRAHRAHLGWLVGLYALLVLLMPRAELLVACLGLVDGWADIRARLGARPAPPGRGDS
jgi:hypothetical protein